MRPTSQRTNKSNSRGVIDRSGKVDSHEDLTVSVILTEQEAA